MLNYGQIVLRFSVKGFLIPLPFILLWILLSNFLVGAGTPVWAGASWSGDGRQWSGAGAVFIPGTGRMPSSNPSSGDGSCDGCRWKVVPLCLSMVDPNYKCVPSLKWNCPDGYLYIAMFALSPDQQYTVVGHPCINSGEGPVSKVELDGLVRDAVAQLPPPLKPRYQPPGGALTQLPTIFAAGQPTVIDRQRQILGFQTRLLAKARWVWSWGDGSTSFSTTKPGGRWPDRSVSHTYTKAGKVKVGVQTKWSATYWVDGYGPFTVDGQEPTQTATFQLPIRQARAVLTF